MRILTNISKAELNYLVNQPTAKALIQKVKREGIYIPAGDVQGARAFVSMRNRQKQNTSATVTISKAGREKARMLNESSKKDDYMKRSESKIDKILDTIREGGTLSKEEEALVNNELKNMSEKKYKDYKDLRLSAEDVLEELKENYMRRERLFFDMQEQLEAEASIQQDDVDTAKIMAYMQEKEYDEETIEMIKKYGEEEEGDLKEKPEDEEVEKKETDELEIQINVGDKTLEEIEPEDANLKKRVMNHFENIEDEMKEVEEASNKARNEEHIFAKGLDGDYKRIQQVLDNDEISIKDKIKAYDRFTQEAFVNAKGREVQRIMKEFDAETLMMARIMFQGHNRMDSVIKGNVDRSQLGAEFVKSFLV